MGDVKPSLLIPVELQVREFEPKLLLACVAANRGFSVLIGPRREMHFHIPSFPGCIYLSKNVTSDSNNVFRNLKRLGDRVVVWGEENAQLWRQYHDMSPETPIYITGNPRGDLLRPELRGYYNGDAEKLREKL